MCRVGRVFEAHRSEIWNFLRSEVCHEPIRSISLEHDSASFLPSGFAPPGRGCPRLAARPSMPPASEKRNRPPSGADFPGKAKHVIYLHMVGGPAQMDLYDYKPKMGEWYDKDLPDSVRMGQRLTTMTSGQARFPIAPSKFKFAQHGKSRHVGERTAALDGARWSTTCASSARMHTEAINHEPAITFMQTGNQITGRPCLGAWASYGLGSLNRQPADVRGAGRPADEHRTGAGDLGPAVASRLSARRTRRRLLPHRRRSDPLHQQSAGRAHSESAARRSTASRR